MPGPLIVPAARVGAAGSLIPLSTTKKMEQPKEPAEAAPGPAETAEALRLHHDSAASSSKFRSVPYSRKGKVRRRTRRSMGANAAGDRLSVALARRGQGLERPPWPVPRGRPYLNGDVGAGASGGLVSFDGFGRRGPPPLVLEAAAAPPRWLMAAHAGVIMPRTCPIPRWPGTTTGTRRSNPHDNATASDFGRIRTLFLRWQASTTHGH